MLETWKDIPGYIGYYQISNTGKVKSLERRITCSNWSGKKYTRFIKETILRPGKDKDEYLQVGLYDADKIQAQCKIHRLVAKAFIPNPDNKPEVNHKNGIKSDNRVENLEWVTNKENMEHSVKNNLNVSGERHGRAKLSNEDVQEIKILLRKGATGKNIAVKYCVSTTTISYIRNKKHWKKT